MLVGCERLQQGWLLHLAMSQIEMGRGISDRLACRFDCVGALLVVGPVVVLDIGSPKRYQPPA
jgi:hypothetical protein